VIFYGSCLDDDATLTSLEAWEAFLDPDDAVAAGGVDVKDRTSRTQLCR
jgi:hypothetical protein